MKKNSNLDPAVREFLSNNGKKAGATTKATGLDYSVIGRKSWRERLKKHGKEGISKQQSEAGKKGALKRWGKKKKNKGGIIKVVNSFLKG